jgi:hypothetical protein
MFDSVLALIERILGPWGMAVLRVYQDNSLLINAAIVLYGFALIVSWRNLDRMRSFLVQAMVQQMPRRAEGDAKPDLSAVLETAAIPWEKALEESRFPLIARQWALLPRRCSLQSIQRLLNPEDLARDVLKIVAPDETAPRRRGRRRRK